MPVTVTKPTRNKIDWEPIESLYLEGYLPHAIAQKTGVDARVISVGLSRRGANKRKLEIAASNQKLDVDTLSRVTRQKIATAADRVVDRLQDPPNNPDLLNQHADTLQKAAKTAALVHGWGETSAVAVVLAGVLTGSEQDQESRAIDIESTAETDSDGT
jgi:hypothetical protein